MSEESHIEKVLLRLSSGPVYKQELENELRFSLPQILFEKGLVTPPNKDGYIKLTRRGISSLGFLTSVREISTLEHELEHVLTTLEKMEEELINLGFYDTITTPEQLAQKLGVSSEDARKNLEKLSEKRYILRLYDKQGNIVGYRSRIAEITRLISCLKQRFSEDDIYDAPNLVGSVKLRIKDRYVTRRSKPLEDLMNELEGYVSDQFESSWKIIKNVLKAWLNYVGIEKVSNFQRVTTLDIFNTLQRMHVGQLDSHSMALVAETGAGKTEAYFIPFMAYLLLRKISQRKAKKTRLIIVYPRVALSLNQFARFTKYLYQINEEIRLHPEHSNVKIYVGIDNESIPRNYGRLKENQVEYSDSWRITEDRAYYKRMFCPVLETLISKIKFECCREIYYNVEDGKFLCGEGHELPIKLFKDQVYGHSDVDVVIMTPNTLMRRLIEDSFIKFLEDTDILVLVFDECHLYSSLPGSHTALTFRRLFRLTERLGVKTIVLGISATMSSADEFFKELVSFRPKKVIMPEEGELERKSVEYYLFVKPEIVSLKRAKINGEEVQEASEELEEELKPIKPLSTMIQTLMCVMHNMRRTQLKNKGLGFVDSIDTLHRWYYAQKDAENRMLFKLRTRKIEKCQNCENGPIISCPEHIVGECWYFAKFDKLSIGLDKPVNLQIYYSERREELKEDKDCILSTSALEVGYDDPSLIAFFQYKGPRSLISFAQRKGRVARSPEDRPINVLVLSPYSSRDNFIFINDDHILNSEYNEIPLNSENYFAQAAHARAAVIDYLAYKNPSVKITYETPISKVGHIVTDFLQKNEKEVIDWIVSVASIYKFNLTLSKGVIEKIKTEVMSI